MKKIFSLILLLVLGFSAFAETGYKGCQWRHSLERCLKVVELEPYFEEDTIESELLDNICEESSLRVLKKNTVILGKQNTVSYLKKETNCKPPPPHTHTTSIVSIYSFQYIEINAISYKIDMQHTIR